MSVITALHLIFSSSLLLYAFSKDETNNTDIFTRFSDYIHRYNKSYKVGTYEFKKRETIFEQTLKRIEWLNKHRNSSQAALYGVNEFSDLTPEEFKNYVHLQKTTTNTQNIYPSKIKILKSSLDVQDLPKHFDWREKNVVTPVNNQGQCGACWAFSTVETIESMNALKHGVLEQLSVQQVLDCAAKPNNGCSGGDTCNVVEWLYKSGTGIVLAKDYPFIAKDQPCKNNVTSEKAVKITRNFTCDSFVGEEKILLMHLAHHGPLMASVDASGWQDYVGGIIEDGCDGGRNHAIQIVGYDISGKVPYYIVRNSWGTQFGYKGYVKVAIGKNMCRIAEEVTAVDVL